MYINLLEETVELNEKEDIEEDVGEVEGVDNLGIGNFLIQFNF